MFSDGRLRVPSTSSLAGQVLQRKKGPIEHSSMPLGGFADFGQIGIHTCSYPLIVVGGGVGKRPATSR
jgi:hypothetical protein